MWLFEYLIANGISQAAFAARLRVSQMAVSRYARRAAIPRPDIMARIVDATGGQVTANDFYGPTEIPGEAPGAAGAAPDGAAPAVAA
jgi:transcriptional regulator with XRE-family HTH domain